MPVLENCIKDLQESLRSKKALRAKRNPKYEKTAKESRFAKEERDVGGSKADVEAKARAEAEAKAIEAQRKLVEEEKLRVEAQTLAQISQSMLEMKIKKAREAKEDLSKSEEVCSRLSAKFSCMKDKLKYFKFPSKSSHTPPNSGIN